MTDFDSDQDTDADSDQDLNEPEETIQLHHAAVWDCDNCGREIFVRVVTIDNSVDQKHVPTKSDKSITISIPRVVTCPHCFTAFSTEDGVI